jgi:hypothetical protein
MIDAGPLRFLVVFFAGWVNRQQRDVIEYLREENRFCGSNWSADGCN